MAKPKAINPVTKLQDATPQIVLRPIAALIPYSRNARTHSDEQVAQIAASLVEFGWTNPILTDGDGGIIAGHGRLLAARKVQQAGKAIPNWPDPAQVPTIPLAHLTPAQRKAYVLADNQLALNAGWDSDMLRLELVDLQDGGFDMGLLGFGDDLAALMAGAGDGGAGGDAGPGAGSLSERFMIPPFSVFNAREGWWQDRKRAWLALGIKSELGRGGGQGTPPHPPTVTRNADGTLNYTGTAGQSERFDRQRQPAGGGAAPGGSARPAADYSKRQRGNGTGRAF
jgi:hypothetical protein